MKTFILGATLLQCASNVFAVTESSFACPADSGSTITDDNGARYAITCGSDLGGDVFEVQRAVTSFKDCFDYCDARKPNCTGWTYSGATNGAGSGYCYLKKGNLYLTSGRNTIVSAIGTTQASFACPADSGSSITDANGVQYTITCGSDLGGSVIETDYAAKSFKDCLNYCAANPSCTGWTYSGAVNGVGSGYCYLKKGNLYLSGGSSKIVAAIRKSPVQQSSSTRSATSTSFRTSTTSSSTATPRNPVPTTSTKSMTTSSTSSKSTSTSSSTTTSKPQTTSTQSSTSTKSISTTTTKLTTTTSITLSSSTTTSSRSSTLTTTSSRSSSSSSSVPSSTPIFVKNNGKRGLAYNNDTLTLPYSQAGQNSQVSWGYDYYYSRYSTKQSTVENPAITFIPLLFNDDPSLTSVWPDAAQSAINAGSDALFSFNEPDFCIGGSACMSINQSVAGYKKYIQPFAGKAKLGAPAVTNAGPPCGLTYLNYFIGNCTGCQIDFINLHWYANSYAFGYLQSYVQQAHQMFPNYPIYITELGLDGGSSLDTEDRKEAFMKNATSWLDSVPYVERWAWFIDAPGNLINDNGTDLSPLGRLYNNYTAPWTGS